MTGLTLIGDVNAQGGSTVTMNAPHASTAIGDLLLIPFAYKRTAAVLGTPSGWAATGAARTVGSTAGAPAVNLGQMKLGLFTRDAPSGFAMPVVAPGGTGAVIEIGSITFRRDTGWTVEFTDSSGSDTSSDTSLSVTGGTVLPYVSGDYLVMMLASTIGGTTGSTYSADGTAPGGVSGAVWSSTLDEKWNSQSTTGDGIRQATYTIKCLSGLATTAPSVAVTASVATTGGAVWYRLHPIHLPYHGLNIGTGSGNNFFKLQYATDGAGAVSEQTLAQVTAGFYLDGIFYPVDVNGLTQGDQDWTRFRVRCDGPNTGGTSYARTELREETSGGADKSFDSSSGQHRMRVRLRWAEYGSTKPTVIGAQVHDGTSDQWQLCTEKNATTGLVEIKSRIDGTSTGQPKAVLDYKLLDTVDTIIDITSGVANIFVNDMVNAMQRSTAVAGSTLFFKSGCYLNFDETDEASTQHGAVDIYQNSLQVWHTGDAGSAPAPLQLNQPTDFFMAA